MAAITGGVDFDGNLSLAAGRDLSCIGDSGAASAGAHVCDIQWGGALVLDDKIINHIGTV